MFQNNPHFTDQLISQKAFNEIPAAPFSRKFKCFKHFSDHILFFAFNIILSQCQTNECTSFVWTFLFQFYIIHIKKFFKSFAPVFVISHFFRVFFCCESLSMSELLIQSNEESTETCNVTPSTFFVFFSSLGAQRRKEYFS